MTKWIVYRRARAAAALAAAALFVTACAVRPIPDPRNPGPIDDDPLTLRVCIVEGDGAHAAVGDRVQFITDRGLRVRHLPGPSNSEGAWNGGEPIRVDAQVLVERVAAAGVQQRAQQDDGARSRRFVPVGRFDVRVGDPPRHVPFDFRLSRTTTPTREHEYPECIADIGDDEVVIRGVMHDDRHGGRIILR